MTIRVRLLVIISLAILGACDNRAEWWYKVYHGEDTELTGVHLISFPVENDTTQANMVVSIWDDSTMLTRSTADVTAHSTDLPFIELVHLLPEADHTYSLRIELVSEENGFDHLATLQFNPLDSWADNQMESSTSLICKNGSAMVRLFFDWEQAY